MNVPGLHYDLSEGRDHVSIPMSPVCRAVHNRWLVNVSE